MKVKIPVTIDVAQIIEEAAQNADMSGIGADGSSEYEVVGVECLGETSITVEVEVEVERVEGKFAPKDEVEERVQDALNEIEGAVV